MSLAPRTFSLLLAMTPGIGGRGVTSVLARNALLSRTPEDFLSLSPEALREEYRLSSKAALELLKDPQAALDDVLELEGRLTTLGVHLVTANDVHYPASLEAFDPDPPGVLFLYGNTKLLGAATFCVLGSRGTPPAGLDQLEKLAEEGVLAGEILVSGHDRPEYQRSAVVPLRWGAPRILCLDRGLFPVLGPNLKDEAFRAARLWRYEFDPITDLVVSPFRPEADFIGINNKVRDRVVAGLSRRLDFVHLSAGGGMERLLKLALKAGRPVRLSDRVPEYRLWRDRGATIVEA